MLNCQLFQGRKALLSQLQRPGGDGQGQDVREATEQSMKYNIFITISIDLLQSANAGDTVPLISP
jgi:hypothetical protein